MFRSLTLTPGTMKATEVAAAPKLPDVRACCVNGGVNHYGCVDKLCDPTKTFDIAVSKLLPNRIISVFSMHMFYYSKAIQCVIVHTSHKRGTKENSYFF